MTDGTSQGLFIVVAIVIFGIFVVLAYILFEDTLSPAMANMFTNATEQTNNQLLYGSQFNHLEVVPDKHLQKAIRESMGYAEDVPITRALLREVTKIHAVVSDGQTVGKYNPEYMNVKSLEGLQYATNLKEITLHNHSVTSLEPLRGLISLTYINFNRNPIESLKPLEDVPNLHQLLISRGEYTDLTPLMEMKDLRTVNLGASKVTDLSPLGSVKSLTQMYIGNMEINSLDFLHDLPNLRHIEYAKSTIKSEYTIPEWVTTEIK